VQRRHGAQVLDVGFVEPQRLEIVERLLEPRRHEIRAVRRQIPDVQLEGGRLGHAGAVIAGHHRDFVEVCGQGKPAHGSVASPPWGRPGHVQS
jgi:hypothetical protein